MIDTTVYDGLGVIRGCWLDPTAAPETLTRQVRELLGREPAAGGWAIVDQVGLGPVMVPETMAVDEVAAVIGELGGEQCS